MSLGPLSTIVYDKFNGDYSVWQKDFISRVKKVYPGATDLYKHLENNDEIAGRYLYDLTRTEEELALYHEWYFTWQKNGLSKVK